VGYTITAGEEKKLKSTQEEVQNKIADFETHSRQVEMEEERRKVWFFLFPSLVLASFFALPCKHVIMFHSLSRMKTWKPLK
jgi:hypothetical protein